MSTSLVQLFVAGAVAEFETSLKDRLAVSLPRTAPQTDSHRPSLCPNGNRKCCIARRPCRQQELQGTFIVIADFNIMYKLHPESPLHIKTDWIRRSKEVRNAKPRLPLL